jgi:hypothetical protein
MASSSGAMIAMSTTMTLKGSVKFSMKKLLAGGEMMTSTYTGPGELLLAPTFLGDVSLIRLNGSEQWSVGKDAFLAATQGVVKDFKRQGISKTMFSGEGLYVYKISGTGIMWIQSFGAILKKDVCHALGYPFYGRPKKNRRKKRKGKRGKPRVQDTTNIMSSSMRMKNTSSITATSSPGTASTSWSGLPLEV